MDDGGLCVHVRIAPVMLSHTSSFCKPNFIMELPPDPSQVTSNSLRSSQREGERGSPDPEDGNFSVRTVIPRYLLISLNLCLSLCLKPMLKL